MSKLESRENELPLACNGLRTSATQYHACKCVFAIWKGEPVYHSLWKGDPFLLIEEQKKEKGRNVFSSYELILSL